MGVEKTWTTEEAIVALREIAQTYAPASDLAKVAKLATAEIDSLRAQRARDNDAKAAVARLNQLRESTDWHVDTLEAREDARKYIPGAIGQRLVFGLCETIEALLVELEEAKSQAIPFRDGPARGGEEPVPGRDFVFTDGGSVVKSGRISSSAKTSILVSSGTGSVGGARVIQRFAYVDMIPTEPTQ